MSDNPQHDPSFLAQGLAAVMTLFAAIGGFIGSQVWSNTKKLYASDQRTQDMSATLARMHAENLAGHADIIRRLERLEALVMRTNSPNE